MGSDLRVDGAGSAVLLADPLRYSEKARGQIVTVQLLRSLLGDPGPALSVVVFSQLLSKPDCGSLLLGVVVSLPGVLPCCWRYAKLSFSPFVLLILTPRLPTNSLTPLTQLVSTPHHKQGRLLTLCLSFSSGANTWLNAFIAMEMRRLLVAARNPREIYVPPNMPMVMLQAGFSYTWAMIISILPAIDRLHMPLGARLQGGAGESVVTGSVRLDKYRHSHSSQLVYQPNMMQRVPFSSLPSTCRALSSSQPCMLFTFLLACGTEATLVVMAQTENWPSTFRESSSCSMSCGCLRFSASSLSALGCHCG